MPRNTDFADMVLTNKLYIRYYDYSIDDLENDDIDLIDIDPTELDTHFNNLNDIKNLLETKRNIIGIEFTINCRNHTIGAMFNVDNSNYPNTKFTVCYCTFETKCICGAMHDSDDESTIASETESVTDTNFTENNECICGDEITHKFKSNVYTFIFSNVFKQLKN